MRNRINIIIIFLISTLTALMIINCSAENSGRMPVTTSSDEALKQYQKGLKYSENARAREAAKHFEQAVQEDPDFAMAILRLAMTKDNAMTIASVLPKLKELYPKLNEGEKIMIDAIEESIDNNHINELEYYQKLVKLYPNDESLRIMTGSNYYGQQKFDEAIAEFKSALEINENYAPAYNMLGYCYKNLDNFSEAEKNFQKYIELIPNDPNPYDSYAELLMNMGRFEESIENYKKALSIDPYFSFSHIGIASNLNFLDRHIEARNQLHKMLETAKSHMLKRQALQALANSFIDERNYESGLKLYDKSMNFCIENNDFMAAYMDMMNKTYLLLRMERYEDAQKMIDEANEFTAKSEELTKAILSNIERTELYARTWLAAKTGKFDEAEKYAAQYDSIAVTADNSNLIRSSHNLQGMIAYNKGDYTAAIEEFRKSNMKSPLVMYRLARTYEKNNEIESALTFYKKAAHANINNDMGYSYIRLDALDKFNQLSNLP